MLRKEFMIDLGEIPLNNAGMAPLPRKTFEKMCELTELHARKGSGGSAKMIQEYAESRKVMAEFLGAQSENLAFTLNTASALSFVAMGYRNLKPGDEILQIDQEYPSNAYPWIQVALKSGATRKVFRSEKDFKIDWEKFISQIESRTKIVALSWVQYQTGESAPLRDISKACKNVGALLVVDAIQGLGLMPFKLKELGVDVVCGGSHKWLCSPIGMGFMAFRENLIQDFDPIVFGAMNFGDHMDKNVSPERRPHPDSRKFEPGLGPVTTAIATGVSLEIFKSHGLENIHKHAKDLSQELRSGLKELKIEVLSSETNPSSIVTFCSPRAQEFSEKLFAKHVHHTLREDRIRLAPHGFNTSEEIQEVLKALSIK